MPTVVEFHGSCYFTYKNVTVLSWELINNIWSEVQIFVKSREQGPYGRGTWFAGRKKWTEEHYSLNIIVYDTARRMPNKTRTTTNNNAGWYHQRIICNTLQ